MKTLIFTCLLLSFYCLMPGQNIQKKNKCYLTGTIKDIDCKFLVLLKANEFYGMKVIEIPVENDAFASEIKIKKPEGFTIVLEDMGNHVIFTELVLFLDFGKNEISIYKEKDKFRYATNENLLNTEYKEYKKDLDSLSKSLKTKLIDSLLYVNKVINQYSDSINLIYQGFAADSSSNELSNFYSKTKPYREARKLLQAKQEQIQNKLRYEIENDIAIWKFNHINQNLSLVSYFFFFKDLILGGNNISNELLKNTFLKFSEKYPNHPYTQLLKTIIEGRMSLKVGNKIIDFSAPDLNDRIFKLSEVIKGKIALIDLWARWCGSCVYKSRLMIPVYEEFKNFGFTILGVLNEPKDMKFAKGLLEREKYPWPVLIDYKNKNKIWEKYGMVGAPGMMLLVDNKGIILKINPTAEDVREILKSAIKN